MAASTRCSVPTRSEPLRSGVSDFYGADQAGIHHTQFGDLTAVGFALETRAAFASATASTPSAGWAVFVATKPSA